MKPDDSLSLERFAQIACHDLKEPLRSITTFSQLLKKQLEGHIDDKSKEFLDFLCVGSLRMHDLVTALEAFAASTNVATEHFSLVDMNQVFTAAIAAVSASSVAPTAEFTVPQGLPPVYGDERQLTLLVQQLLSNSLKFVKEVPVKILISFKLTGDRWEFGIRDNGIGFRPAEAQEIFLPFKRLNSKDRYPGTGLGLAICKNIIRLHRGELWAEAEPSKGALFCFTLPTI